MNGAQTRSLSALRGVTFHPKVAPFHGDSSHVCNAMDEASLQLQSSILRLQKTGFRGKQEGSQYQPSIHTSYDGHACSCTSIETHMSAGHTPLSWGQEAQRRLPDRSHAV